MPTSACPQTQAFPLKNSYSPLLLPLGLSSCVVDDGGGHVDDDDGGGHVDDSGGHVDDDDGGGGDDDCNGDDHHVQRPPERRSASPSCQV